MENLKIDNKTIGATSDLVNDIRRFILIKPNNKSDEAIKQLIINYENIINLCKDGIKGQNILSIGNGIRSLVEWSLNIMIILENIDEINPFLRAYYDFSDYYTVKYCSTEGNMKDKEFYAYTLRMRDYFQKTYGINLMNDKKTRFWREIKGKKGTIKNLLNHFKIQSETADIYHRLSILIHPNMLSTNNSLIGRIPELLNKVIYNIFIQIYMRLVLINELGENKDKQYILRKYKEFII